MHCCLFTHRFRQSFYTRARKMLSICLYLLLSAAVCTPGSVRAASVRPAGQTEQHTEGAEAQHHPQMFISASGCSLVGALSDQNAVSVTRSRARARLDARRRAAHVYPRTWSAILSNGRSSETGRNAVTRWESRTKCQFGKSPRSRSAFMAHEQPAAVFAARCVISKATTHADGAASSRLH